MKKITYSDHLKFRIKIRNIPYSLPENIFLNAKERYFDKLTGNRVAVKRVLYKNKQKEIMVAYQESSTEVRLITTHPLKLEQKFNRK